MPTNDKFLWWPIPRGETTFMLTIRKVDECIANSLKQEKIYRHRDRQLSLSSQCLATRHSFADDAQRSCRIFLASIPSEVERKKYFSYFSVAFFPFFGSFCSLIQMTISLANAYASQLVCLHHHHLQSRFRLVAAFFSARGIFQIDDNNFRLVRAKWKCSFGKFVLIRIIWCWTVIYLFEIRFSLPSLTFAAHIFRFVQTLRRPTLTKSFEFVISLMSFWSHSKWVWFLLFSLNFNCLRKSESLRWSPHYFAVDLNIPRRRYIQ